MASLHELSPPAELLAKGELPWEVDGCTCCTCCICLMAIASAFCSSLCRFVGLPRLLGEEAEEAGEREEEAEGAPPPRPPLAAARPRLSGEGKRAARSIRRSHSAEPGRGT